MGEGKDLSTSIVMDWLLYYDCPFLFLHEKNFIGKVQIQLSEGVEKISLEINDDCGKVGKSLFLIKRDVYYESLNHNTCLNRKISIDQNGNIKNCPSMQKSYGNIKDTTLKEALAHPDFKQYWNIDKDKIHVCKDCEFRHICTDCRAYIEDPEDIYSKPLKCGYNPYTGEWSEWSTNPLKQKAINYYDMRELVEEKNLKE